MIGLFDRLSIFKLKRSQKECFSTEMILLLLIAKDFRNVVDEKHLFSILSNKLKDRSKSIHF